MEPPEHIPTLSDAGIDKKLSSRAQKMAAVPEEKFEEMMGEWRKWHKKERPLSEPRGWEEWPRGMRPDGSTSPYTRVLAGAERLVFPFLKIKPSKT